MAAVPHDRDDTLVPAAMADTVVPASPSSPTGGGSGTSSGAATTARVGDDLRAVSLSRFGAVERDRYEILGELARGGLGRVYRARDPRTGRIVALKEVLRPSADLLVRFAREALVTANLQHPSIVPVYEVGRWPGGEPFYAMKLVNGRALDDVIADARTTAARVALVPHVIAVADALAYAHGEHVIHRDLKPANVLVGAYGETVVIDWGLARNLAGGPGGGDESLAPTIPPVAAGASTPGETVAGAVVGTPAYMAPEQAKGQPLDERADVYAIGAILYHVLAGERPYAAARTIAEVLVEVGAGPPRPLAELVPDAPRELVAIVERAMARAPDDRYPTARELAEDLRRFVSGQLVGAHAYTRGQLLRRWVARHRAAVVTASIALAALLGFGVISVRRIAAERDRAEHERAEAQSSRALAERRFADSLEELGRQAARDGAPERALVFLAGAAAASPARPALDVMLGDALAAFAGLVAVVPGHVTGTISADLSPDGAVLYTTGRSELRAWDVGPRTARWTAAGYHHAAVSPDGKWILAAGFDATLALLAAADGTVARTWQLAGRADGEELTLLAWDPGGLRFAAATKAGQVVVASVDDGGAAPEPLVAPTPHRAEVYALAFAPGGRALVSCSKDGAVTLRDRATAVVRATLVSAGSPPAVACTWLDEGRLVAADDRGAVRDWRVGRDGVAVLAGRVEHGPDLYGIAGGIRPASGAGEPGDAWLVTYGHGPDAKLWDLDRRALRATLPGHASAGNGAAAVNGLAVTTDESGQIRVWDPRNGALLQALPREGLESIVARGDTLVSYGEGRTRLWKPRRDARVRHLDGHTARVRDLAFDRAGTTLWSASNDGTARGVALDTARMPDPADPSASPSSDAVRVLGQGGFSEPTVREPADGAGLPPNPRGTRSLTLAPDGKRVATASEDGAIALWDAATGAPLATWRGHTGRVRRVIFSRDGAVAYSVGDTTVRRWDAASGRELARADVGDTTWDVALVGDDVIATLGDDRRSLALWRADTLAPHAVLEAPTNRMRDLVVVDGDRVLVATQDELLAVDRAGKIIARTAHYGVFAAHPAPGGGPIAAGDPRGEVVLHDRATLAPIRNWRIGETVITAVRFRPDGAVLATADGRRVRLWDPATGRALAVSPEVPGMITQLAWSPDGRTLAFAGGSGTVWLWPVAADPAGADLAAFVRCVAPWQLGDGALVAAPYDRDACAAVAR